jgi:hypothetical protein
MNQVINSALLAYGDQGMPTHPYGNQDTSCQHGVPHTYIWGGGAYTGSFIASTKEKQRCWHTVRVCGHNSGASLYVKPEGGTHSTDKLCTSRAMSQNN